MATEVQERVPPSLPPDGEDHCHLAPKGATAAYCGWTQRQHRGTKPIPEGAKHCPECGRELCPQCLSLRGLWRGKGIWEGPS